jgi:NAD(P)H-flavin reductase
MWASAPPIWRSSASLPKVKWQYYAVRRSLIKLSIASLNKMGFKNEQIITTLEMRMKCGIGKCGRCNIGSKYVCLDGPVFR